MNRSKSGKASIPASKPVAAQKSKIQHSKFPDPITLQNRETDYATVWATLDALS